jgi:hypothetical protein
VQVALLCSLILIDCDVVLHAAGIYLGHFTTDARLPDVQDVLSRPTWSKARKLVARKRMISALSPQLAASRAKVASSPSSAGIEHHPVSALTASLAHMFCLTSGSSALIMGPGAIPSPAPHSPA